MLCISKKKNKRRKKKTERNPAIQDLALMIEGEEKKHKCPIGATGSGPWQREEDDQAGATARRRIQRASKEKIQKMHRYRRPDPSIYPKMLQRAVQIQSPLCHDHLEMPMPQGGRASAGGSRGLLCGP